MTQYVINIGALPNDGTGDPLRTAFNEVNLNFDQVFAAGPVLSNIRIANNTILTTNTNGNLVLAPNGIGLVQSNVSIVPNSANIRNLGSADRRWSTVYTQYLDVSANLTISGNIIYNGDLNVAGNLTVNGDLIEVGNIVTDSKTIQLANTAGTTAAANGSGITVGANDLIATYLFDSSADAWTTNIGITAVGNIAAPYFLGNGSQLSGVRADTLVGNTLSSNVLFSSLTSVGTLTALNVTGNVSATGNIIGGNVETTGLITATGNIIGGNITTTGNVSADYVIVAGGIVAEASASPAPSLSGFGNITSGNLITTGMVTATGNVTGGNVASGNLITGVTLQVSDATVYGNVDSVMVNATGNVVAGQYFIGDGSLLTGIGASYNDADVANLLAAFGANIINSTGNITTTANVSGGYILGDGSQLTNLPVQPGTYGDSNVVTLLGAFGSNNVSTTGNITAGLLIGNGSVLTDITGANVTGTVANASYATSAGSATTATSATTANTVTDAAQPNITSVGTLTSVTSSGNVQGGNLLTGGLISAAGNVTGAYIFGNGSQLTDINAVTIDITDTNGLTTVYYPTFVENRSTGQIARADVDLSYRTDTNTLTVGNLSATGNVTGTFILGNGSQLTGIISSYGDSNVATLLANFGSNAVSTTGNVTSGNLTTSGTVSATGNVNSNEINANRAVLGNIGGSSISADGRIFTSGNVVAGNVNSNGILFSTGNIVGPHVNVTGNVVAGNVNSNGLLFAVGNIVGANLDSYGIITAIGNVTTNANVNANNLHASNRLSVTGNIVAGNVNSNGLLFATGNVVGGNVNSNGRIFASGNIQGANIDTTGSISAVGNVIGDYFFGNGSQLTGIVVSGGTSIDNGISNVSIASANGPITVSYNGSGNTWTFGNTSVPQALYWPDGSFQATAFVGQATDLVSTGNATITSDALGVSYVWTFDDIGNLTLPTNGSIVVDGGDGAIGPVSDDLVISWDNEEIRLVSVQGSIEMQADNAFRVQTSYDGPNVIYGSRWEFSNNEIVNITGDFGIVSEVGNLTLSGGRDGVNSGNTTVRAVNVGVLVADWVFDNTGNLTAPGNIITTANVYGDVGLFNDINLNNAGTNRMLYVDGDRNIYDTDFSYDSANSVISGTGNIIAGYFIGDGSQLTGLSSSYGNANVDVYLSSGTMSANIITTGNVDSANVNTSRMVIGNIGGSSISADGRIFTSGNVVAGNVNSNGILFSTGNIVGPHVNVTGNVVAGNVNSNGVIFATGNITAVGNIITSANVVGNTSGYTIGYRDIPQVAFSANTTAALIDAGKHYYSTTAGNLNLTLPDDSSVTFPDGATLTIVLNAAGNVLVSQGTGVTLYQAGSATTGNRVVGAYGLATVMKVSANTWVINGTGVY